jgi:hypothetical protein
VRIAGRGPGEDLGPVCVHSCRGWRPSVAGSLWPSTFRRRRAGPP